MRSMKAPARPCTAYAPALSSPSPDAASHRICASESSANFTNVITTIACMPAIVTAVITRCSPPESRRSIRSASERSRGFPSTSSSFTTIVSAPRAANPGRAPAADFSSAMRVTYAIAGSPGRRVSSMCVGATEKRTPSRARNSRRRGDAEQRTRSIAPPLQDLARRDNRAYTPRNEGEGSPPGAAAHRRRARRPQRDREGPDLVAGHRRGDARHPREGQRAPQAHQLVPLAQGSRDGRAVLPRGGRRGVGLPAGNAPAPRRRDGRRGGGAYPAAAGPGRPRRPAVRQLVRQGLALPHQVDPLRSIDLQGPDAGGDRAGEHSPRRRVPRGGPENPRHRGGIQRHRHRERAQLPQGGGAHDPGRPHRPLQLPPHEAPARAGSDARHPLRASGVGDLLRSRLLQARERHARPPGGLAGAARDRQAPAQDAALDRRPRPLRRGRVPHPHAGDEQGPGRRGGAAHRRRDRPAAVSRREALWSDQAHGQPRRRRLPGRRAGSREPDPARGRGHVPREDLAARRRLRGGLAQTARADRDVDGRGIVRAMKLTPLDLQQKTFRKVTLGGLDEREVRSWLDLVATQLEELTRQLNRPDEEQRRRDARINAFKDREQLLQQTLTTTQKVAEEMKVNARKEADIVLSDAELQAEKIIANAQARS